MEELFAKNNNLHFEENVSEGHGLTSPLGNIILFQIFSRQISGK